MARPVLLDAWRLLPLAETDGSGGFAALWFAPSGDSRYVLLGSEGGAPPRLADAPVDFLRLIAIGYDELTSWVWDEPVSVDEDDEDTTGRRRCRSTRHTACGSRTRPGSWKQVPSLSTTAE